jgi:hypothetical protein
MPAPKGWHDMFDSLDETIKHDDSIEISPKERMLKTVAVGVISILLFGALYLAVKMLG